MSCRFRTRCTVFVFVPVLVAGMVLWQQIGAQAQAIGNPNAGNNWDTSSAVQIFATSGDAGGRPAVNIINGTGISGANGEFNESGAGAQMFADSWLARNANASDTSSAQPGTVVGSHWVELQFNQTYNMGTTWFWNWNEDGRNGGYNGGGFGMKNIEVQYSTDNATWHTAFTGQLGEAPGQGAASQPNLIFNFPAGAQAQYVVITDTSTGANVNWGASTQLGDLTDAGMGEVRFYPAGATVPSLTPGDINGDGKVDLTDYGILTAHWNQTVPANTLGDVTGDGKVNLQDFGIFKQDYNSFNGIGGGGLAGPPVPEPETLILLAAATPVLFVLRRRRQQKLAD